MDPMDHSPDSSPAPKRRKFRIQSQFGEPRQWRSRKSRPCDTCRRRKTACVIDTRPPCRYCQSKGIACLATAEVAAHRPSSSGSRSPDQTADLAPSSPPSAVSAGRRHPPLPPPSPAPPPPPRHHASPSSLPSITVLADAAASLAPAEVLPSLQSALSPPWSVVPDDSGVAAESVSVASLLTTGLPTTIPTATSTAHTTTTSTTTTETTYTLEDNEGETAHSMGLSGEQDAELLASFRSAVMNEANRVDADILQVYAGDLASNRPPVHFNMLHDEFAPLDNAVKDLASERIEAAVRGSADDLVRLYFKHVHPVYPLLSKTRFLRAYYGGNKKSIPASVRGAVYGLASNFWRRDPAYSARPLSGLNQHELFEDALASLQREFHGPDLWTLQGCLLLIHENSAENATIETPRVWTLSSQAVACAQIIGLHRDPTSWHIAPWEKHLRTKLWWATFATDVWSSVCHGNPPHIYRESYTTPPLTMEDLAWDEEVPLALAHTVDDADAHTDIAVCARLFQNVAVSRIVHELLLTSFSDVVYLESMKSPLDREAGLLEVRQKLKNWASLLPRCIDMRSPTSGTLQNNAPVHLSYYAAVALTFRALMSPVTKAAKLDPQSSLRRYFSSAINDFGPFIDFMHSIPPECMYAFWGLHARSQLILCGNFLIYLFLLAPDPDQVQDTFQLLGKFHDSLQRLSAVADMFAISVLRPVALRIDSFFTQAAQIMRTAQCTDSSAASATSPNLPPPVRLS